MSPGGRPWSRHVAGERLDCAAGVAGAMAAQFPHSPTCWPGSDADRAPAQVREDHEGPLWGEGDREVVSRKACGPAAGPLALAQHVGQEGQHCANLLVRSLVEGHDPDLVDAGASGGDGVHGCGDGVRPWTDVDAGSMSGTAMVRALSSSAICRARR